MSKDAESQAPAEEDAPKWHPRLSRISRQDRFARDFTAEQVRSLKNLGCTAEQIDRLRTSLRVIASRVRPAPKLGDVRAPLNDLAKKVGEAAKALESILKAPEHDDARTEAKERLRDAIFSLRPEHCIPNPQKVSFFNDHDERIDEAERLLATLRDVETIAKHALTQMPDKANKAPADPHPIACIHDALRFGWAPDSLRPSEPIPPSASITSNFRKIVGICYEAARVPKSDPERAIRTYLKTLDKGSKN